MSGIAKVYVRREDPDAPIELVFCRADDTCAQVTPGKHISIMEGRHWRADKEFTHAAVASESWMQVGQSLNEARY